MNNTRRKALTDIQTILENAKNDLESIRDEEQEYLDNMPESLQGGEKADIAENAISELDNAINTLDDVTSSIDEAIA